MKTTKNGERDSKTMKTSLLSGYDLISHSPDNQHWTRVTEEQQT